MNVQVHPALISLLTVLLIALAMYLVGRARGKHQVRAPAISGHPDFERAFRAHQNTIEQAVMFLPALWVAALYSDPRIVAGLGYAWLLGRLWYLWAYLRVDGKRGPGFMLAILATLCLLLLGGWGLVGVLLQA